MNAPNAYVRFHSAQTLSYYVRCIKRYILYIPTRIYKLYNVHIETHLLYVLNLLKNKVEEAVSTCEGGKC